MEVDRIVLVIICIVTFSCTSISSVNALFDQTGAVYSVAAKIRPNADNRRVSVEDP